MIGARACGYIVSRCNLLNQKGFATSHGRHSKLVFLRYLIRRLFFHLGITPYLQPRISCQAFTALPRVIVDVTIWPYPTA